jgi:ribosomal protein S18 acetylase RimI-like enzyme
VNDLIENNLFEYSAFLACRPEGEIYQTANLGQIITGLDVFNRVTFSRFSEIELANRIREIVNFYRERNLSFSWLVGPASQPARLGESLEQNGLAYLDEWAGMALDLTTNYPDLKKALAPFGLKIVRVNSVELFDQWVNTACQGFTFSNNLTRRYRKLFSTIPLLAEAPLQLYLAFLDGQPVSTGALFLSREAAGIYWLSTVPAYRKKGIARAVTLHLLREACLKNCPKVVLHATNSSFHLYQTLGFKEYCRIKIYTSASVRLKVTQQIKLAWLLKLNILRR